MKKFRSHPKFQVISRHGILIKNFSYLSVLQVFNLLLPLVTFPYLIRVLGKETYGLVIYAQAVIAYLSILINFGFNISATKDISLNRDNPEGISRIVNAVIVIKLFLFVVSLGVLLLAVSLIPGLRQEAPLYLLTFGVCLYETLFPVWYFQGKEKMKYITYINVLSRGVFTLLIFVFIHRPEDYLLVPVLNTVGALLAGLVSAYLLFGQEKIAFRIPGLPELVHQFRTSAPFFLSRATGVIIMRTNTVLIGTFLSYTEVAYYDLAVKISDLCKVPSNLINQTIFPRVSLTRDMKMVARIIKYNFVLSLLIYAGIVIFSNPIIQLLGGEPMLPARNVIFLLNLTTPLAGISWFLGNTMLVVNGYYREFNMSVIYEAALYLVLAGLLVIINQHNLYSLASVVVLCGAFETGYRYYYVRKHQLL